MSNLCQEITLPTYPIQHIDDEFGEIALCILSAINVGKVKSDSELEELCDLSVRGLEELIDYQKYPVVAAEVATKARRSLGIGFIGLAHYLAKLGYKYDSQEAWDAVHGLSEAFCPHKCLQRAVPLCQMQQTESNLLATTCPLKRVRKDLLSRLFRPMGL